MANATETADVVIIGGGVMGCSIACNLALTANNHGLRRIVLLERDTLGSGSTGRSSGAIRMHYSTAVNAELAWRSLHVFRNFDDIIGGDCGYVDTGYLVFAGADDLDAFRTNIATQQSVGVITDIIGAADAAALAPGFAVEDAAAIAYEPYSGHAGRIRHRLRLRDAGAIRGSVHPAANPGHRNRDRRGMAAESSP